MLSSLKNSINALSSDSLQSLLKEHQKQISKEIVSQSKNKKLKLSEIIDIFNNEMKNENIKVNKVLDKNAPMCQMKTGKGKECKSHICEDSDTLCSRHYKMSLIPKEPKNKCKYQRKDGKGDCGKNCEDEYCKSHLKVLERNEEKKNDEKREKKEEKQQAIKPTKNKKIDKYTFTFEDQEFVLDNPTNRNVIGVLKKGKIEELSKKDIGVCKKNNFKCDEGTETEQSDEESDEQSDEGTESEGTDDDDDNNEE